MADTQKIKTALFKFLLIILAAAAPIYITSSYKSESFAKYVGFQKSINHVQKKKGPIDSLEMQKKFKGLSIY